MWAIGLLFWFVVGMFISYRVEEMLSPKPDKTPAMTFKKTEKPL